MTRRIMGLRPLMLADISDAQASPGLIGLPRRTADRYHLSSVNTPVRAFICKPLLEILAGIPTIVYGYFRVSVLLTPCVITPLFESLLGVPDAGIQCDFRRNRCWGSPMIISHGRIAFRGCIAGGSRQFA